MLIFVAAEQLSRLVHHRATPGALTSSAALPPTDVAPMDLASVNVNAHEGTRYQLLRALRAMAKGEMMVVEHKIPHVSQHLENPGRRDAWFGMLRSAASWRVQNEIEPVLVPGTAYPFVIGRILLRTGCCAPSEQPHWVPNLRFFLLTASGHETFRKAQARWSGLTTLERLRAMVLE
jgi:hypothetical protein